MPLIERLIPKGINKDVSPRALDQGGNRLVVNPLTHALNARYVTSETDELGIFQNIPGNILYDLALPAGTNKTIGTYPDIESNKIVFCNHNSNSNHGVYLFDPVSKVFTTVLVSSIFNFSSNPKYRVTGMGMVNGIFFFTDNLNPQRALNTRRVYGPGTTADDISLFKRAPLKRPTINAEHRSGGDSVIINYVARNNYQFATQYIFLDNEVSALSDYSTVSPASPPGNDLGMSDESTTTRGSVSVSHYYDTDLVNSIKEVRCLFRRVETEAWKIYKTVLQGSLSGGVISTRLYDNISYDEVDEVTAVKYFETIPNRSRALTTFKNRNFLVADRDGFNVESYGTLTPSISTEALGSAPDTPQNWEFYLKEGGSYSLGIEYFDGPKRSMGVFNPVNISVPYINTIGATEINIATKQKVTVSISGTAPSTAKYFRIVKTKEQTYENYMQFPAKILYYVSEKGTNTVAGTESEYGNGKIYLKNRPSTPSGWSQVHFQLPNNLPFVPDKDCFVRIVYAGGVGTRRFTQIINYDGEIIATDNFGLTNWTSLPKAVLIEVFKFKKEKEKFYYGASDLFTVNQSTFAHDTTSVILKMDTVTLRNRVTFTNLSKSAVLIGDTYDPTVSDIFSYYEAPTTAPIKSITNTEIATQNNASSIFGDAKIPDYSKLINNLGRETLLANNPVELTRNTTIKYSDAFIQDSNINGLTSFFAANEYPLPQNRTPIVKLQPADQVLLAIHERNVTSLYVGEGVIQDSRGSTIITKTDAVIGQDKVLDGGYGTYHPESIAEVNGIVFGFDIFKGTPWRYTVAGVKPINFGMSLYFDAKAKQYLPYRDAVAILGGIDPSNKEYLLTFPPVGDIVGETWAFNFDSNEWSQASYIPEAYAHINDQAFAFMNGKIYEQNVDFNNYNTFFGVKYNRQLRFSLNPAPTKVKNYMALQISADKLSQDDVDGIFVRCYDKEGQETYMWLNEFEKLEGIYYGSILKDIHSVVQPGQMALREGNDMRSQVLDLLFEYNGKDAGKFRYANVVFAMSEYSH